jgi:hypothetical protein
MYIKWHREVSLERIAASFHTLWNEVKRTDIGLQRSLFPRYIQMYPPVDGCAVGWPPEGPMPPRVKNGWKLLLSMG